MWDIAVRKLLQGDCYQVLEKLVNHEPFYLEMGESVVKTILNCAITRNHQSLLVALLSCKNAEGQTIIDKCQYDLDEYHKLLLEVIRASNHFMVSKLIDLQDDNQNYLVDFTRERNEIVRAMVNLCKSRKIFKMIYNHPSFDKNMITDLELWLAIRKRSPIALDLISLHKDRVDITKDNFKVFYFLLQNDQGGELLSYFLHSPKIDSFFREEQFSSLNDKIPKFLTKNLICLFKDERMQPFFDNDKTFYDMILKIGIAFRITNHNELLEVIEERRMFTFDLILKTISHLNFVNQKFALKLLKRPSIHTEIPSRIEELIVDSNGHMRLEFIDDSILTVGYRYFPFEKHLPRWLNEYMISERKDMVHPLTTLCKYFKKRKDKITFPRDTFQFIMDDVERLRDERPKLASYMKEILSSVV